MQRAVSNDNPTSQTRPSGIVIAAIGLHLLICSIATAANACGDSIDRSARRLPAQVAQALREMVDRSSSQTSQHTFIEEIPGYTLSECPVISDTGINTPVTRSHQSLWARRLHNLPPPAKS
jgi:hypothetical protein